MFLFCSNQVKLAVFKFTVCTNKLLVQSLVYTYQINLNYQFNFSLLTISFLYYAYTVFKNECSQFKNNILR